MFGVSMAVRSGLFAEGRFMGKVLDEWINDLPRSSSIRSFRICLLPR